MRGCAASIVGIRLMAYDASHDELQKRHAFDDLIAVMKALRSPETGCPWDLEQDFASIAPYTIEEAYEVADAIAKNDRVALREELEGLLFQPIYHAQMAAEEGAFDIHDVIHDVTAKMIHRHPHVFGDEAAASAGDVDQIWDAQKDKEKTIGGRSILDDVPLAFPACCARTSCKSAPPRSGLNGRILPACAKS